MSNYLPMFFKMLEIKNDACFNIYMPHRTKIWNQNIKKAH